MPQLTFSLQARFILSTDPEFQEVGAKSRIKYLDDFNRYKRFISDNFDSPSLTATFARLNWEILSISSSAAGSTADNQSWDDDDDEEARMKAELWNEHGMPLLIHAQRFYLLLAIPGSPNIPAPPQSPEPHPTVSSPPLSSPAPAHQTEITPAPSPVHDPVPAPAKKSKAGGKRKPATNSVENDVAAGGTGKRTRSKATKRP